MTVRDETTTPKHTPWCDICIDEPMQAHAECAGWLTSGESGSIRATKKPGQPAAFVLYGEGVKGEVIIPASDAKTVAQTLHALGMDDTADLIHAAIRLVGDADQSKPEPARRHAPLNSAGGKQAWDIRTAASELNETENLRDTSCLREIFFDLGEALADLVEPVTALVTEFTERDHDDDPADLPDATLLRDVAEGLRYCANNL